MRRLVYCLLVVLVGTPVAAIAQDSSFTVTSRHLGETVRLHVALPPGYASDGERYPLLFVLDGRTHLQHTATTARFLANNGNMPGVIVVAVPTSDRNRDYTTRPGPDFPVPPFMRETGGADRYLTFFREELIPALDERFRTVPHRILIGHSLGGFFALHALGAAPDLFRTVIALDPSAFWDRGVLIRSLPASAGLRTAPVRAAWVDGRVSQNVPPPHDTLRTWLEHSRPAPMQFVYRTLPDEGHNEMPLMATYVALKTLYADYAPRLGRGTTADSLDAHYASLSAAYGYGVRTPEAVFNRVGYNMLNGGRVADAIAVFTRAVATYPNAPNTHDSLGEALQQAGRAEEARTHFERAVALARQQGDARLPLFEARLQPAGRR